MKWVFLVFPLIFVLASSSAKAEPSHEAVEILSNIPSVLLNGLKPVPVTREDYIESHLAYITFYGRSHDALDRKDFELAKQYEIRVRTNSKRQDFTDYDIDQDKRLSYDEFYAMRLKTEACVSFSMAPGSSSSLSLDDFVENQSSGTLQNHACSEMLAKKLKKIPGDFEEKDSDNNNLLEFNEYYNISAKGRDALRRKYQHILDYLELDTNQDGRLTHKELRDLAGITFSTVDTNQDGVFDQNDSVYYKKSKHFNFLKAAKTICGLNTNNRFVCKHPSQRHILKPVNREVNLESHP